MRRILTLVLCLISVQVFAQNYPINGILITLPANPDASLTKWGAGTLTLSATAKMNNGRLEPRVQDSKILVSIKKGGGKVCGAFESNTAPAANFNTPSKVWAGNNAVSLIGRDCTLPQGDYELCVQFFGAGPTGLTALSEEKCKSFSIRNAEVQTYQSPQPISPANGTEISEADLKKPMTFRWGPVSPRPRDAVTYRIRVWELMPGQNGPQAIKNRTPDITNDVNNLTQASIFVRKAGGHGLQEYLWNVQAVDRDGKPIGGNDGTSETFKIMVQPINDQPSVITLLTPKDGTVLSANDQLKFSWNHDRQQPGPPSIYKIRVVSEDAAGNSKTFFEKDGLLERNFQYPSSGPKFENGKKYTWQIEARRIPAYGEVKNTESKINEFVFNNDNSVSAPINGCLRQSIGWAGIAAELNKVSNCAVSVKVCSSYSEVYTISQHQHLWHGASTYVFTVADQNAFIATAKQWALSNRPVGCNNSLKSVISITYFAYPIPGIPSQNKEVAFSVDYGCCVAFQNQERKISLISPANGDVVQPGQKLTFTWRTSNFRSTGDIPVPGDYDGDGYYKITIVEIIGDQSPENALRGNKPFFERDSLRPLSFQYPSSAPNFKAGKKYGWQVYIYDRWGQQKASTVSMFSVSGCDVNLNLKLKSVECLPSNNGANNYKICLSATYNSSTYNLTYANTGSGFKAYNPTYSLFYGISNITPSLQVQNSGSTTTVNYCFDVIVTAGQTAIKIGLQGDDKDPGPIVCQPGAELDVQLPNCRDKCECGTWGKLTVQNAAGVKRYDCGNEIEARCNQPFNFSTSYQCKPNNKDCQAKTQWTITKDGSPYSSGTGTTGAFTPTANGTYTITLDADCNGVKCPPCVYKIIVVGCIGEKCECGTWSKLTVQNAAGVKRYDCGNEIEARCNQPFNFSTSYECKPNNKDCQAKTQWTITKDGNPYSSGTGTTGVFTPTANGVYTITLDADCNGVKCPPCVYKIIVVGCIGEKCECGTWGKLTVQNAAGVKRYDCESEIEARCNQPFNFSTSYQCKPNNKDCQAKTQWTITKDGNPYSSGTGTAGAFTPTVNGVYTITLDADCNGIKCPPCVYKIIVVGCIGEKCECGTWGKLTVQNAAGVKRYDCGNEIEARCNQPFNFSTSYQCKPNNKDCQAKTQWMITKDGNPYSSGTGTTGAFTPTANGVYTITLDADCNGVKCTPCVYKIIVRDCVIIGDKCDCGTWGKLTVQNAAGVKRYDCESEIEARCKQPFNFSTSYQCKPNNDTCKAKVKWTITKDGSPYSSGTGTAGAFTPTANGTYTITLDADCNGVKCPPCVYKIIVRDCVIIGDKCECGTWGPLVLQNAAGTVKYECGKEIPWKCKQPFNFSTSYQCKPNNDTCKAKVKWTITKDGNPYSSGTGTAGAFTPTANGVYTITLDADCSGVKCIPCVYKIIVRDCIIIGDKCDCGTWKPLIIYETGGPKAANTGNEIDWVCKNEFKFTSGYVCNPNNKNCSATVNWTITKDGNPYSNGTGVNGGFTPTLNGVYTLTLNADCNGERCSPYTFTINVKECPHDKECICGTWKPLVINDGVAPVAISLDGEIKWSCKKEFRFNIGYACNPVNKNCLAVVNWTITKDGIPYSSGTGYSGAFTPTTNGVYILTLNANCGGEKCPPSIYRIIVTGCDQDCKCRSWKPLSVRNGDEVLTLACGKNITWNCKKPFSFNTGYTCYPDNETCNAKVQWNITKDGNPYSSGNGLSGTFTPTANGVYTLTFNADCNGNRCPECTYTITVTDCSDVICSCSNDMYLIANPGNFKVRCSETKIYPFGTNVTLNPGNICNPQSCLGDWQINVYDLITGSNIKSQNGNGSTAGISITLNSSSGYRVEILTNCGGQRCKCTIYLKTEPTTQSCACGNWKEKIISYNSSATCGVLNCNKRLNVPSGVAYTFVAPEYNCAISNDTCKATYEWFVNGVSQGTSQSFPYTFINVDNRVVIKTYCAGKVCDSCTFDVKTNTYAACDTSVNVSMMDSTTFKNSLSVSQLIDFNTYADGVTMQDHNPIGDFALPCWTRNGITFSDARSYYNTFIYGGTIKIVFPPGTYKKAGFELFQFYGLTGVYTIKVFAGNCIYTYVRNAPGNIPHYFGVNTTATIDKIEVSFNTGAVVVENFRFGN